MRLSNNFLLSAVWSAAVTSLVMLLAAMASADVMTSDVLLREIWSGIDPDANPEVRHGTFAVSFDPASVNVFDPDYEGFGRPDTVRFIIETNNNNGWYAWDDSPQGWIDVQAMQWDLTVDGISCECFGGGDDPDRLRPLFLADSMRLVNTADDVFIERTTSTGMTVRESAESVGLEWRNVAVVPEPAAAYLLLVGLMLCVGGRTQ